MNTKDIDVSEWVHHEFRSAFLLPQDRPGGFVRELFTYSRSQPIVGTTRMSELVHTNIPRSGDSGLPRDWGMVVLGWRATTDAPMDEALMRWAAATVVRFEYNSRWYADAPLANLLRKPQPLLDRPVTMEDFAMPRRATSDESSAPLGGALPIYMRDNISYKVDVAAPHAESDAFRAHLACEWPGGVTQALGHLRALQMTKETSPLVSAAIGALTKDVTFWVHFNGLLKRPIQ